MHNLLPFAKFKVNKDDLKSQGQENIQKSQQMKNFIQKARKTKITQIIQKVNSDIGQFEYKCILEKGNTIKYLALNGGTQAYYGDAKNYMPHGIGEVYFNDGSYLTGVFQNGALTENYRLIKPDGSYFQIAQQSNSHKHHGILYSHQVSYKGEVQYNLHQYVAHGIGQETTSKYKFSGRFVRGDKFYGKLIFDKGQYEGEIRNNQFHGFGLLKTEEGTYSGQFSHGKKQGEGQFTWKDGSKYIGQYKDDKKHGKGKYTSHEVSYQGQWVHGQREGNGWVVQSDGKAYGGQWNSGHYEFPKHYF